jgi:GTPase SAR1 family protein
MHIKINLNKINFKLARVGKTSLTMRFCRDEFDDKQISTLNAAFMEKSIRINDPLSPNSQAQKLY